MNIPLQLTVGHKITFKWIFEMKKVERERTNKIIQQMIIQPTMKTINSQHHYITYLKEQIEKRNKLIQKWSTMYGEKIPMQCQKIEKIENRQSNIRIEYIGELTAIDKTIENQLGKYERDIQQQEEIHIKQQQEQYIYKKLPIQQQQQQQIKVDKEEEEELMMKDQDSDEEDLDNKNETTYEAEPNEEERAIAYRTSIEKPISKEKAKKKRLSKALL